MEEPAKKLLTDFLVIEWTANGSLCITRRNLARSKVPGVSAEPPELSRRLVVLDLRRLRIVRDWELLKRRKSLFSMVIKSSDWLKSWSLKDSSSDRVRRLRHDCLPACPNESNL